MGCDRVEAVRAQKSAGRLVPGLGHPVHKQCDPRTPVLIAMAREHGQYGPHLALFEAIGTACTERYWDGTFP